VVLIGLAFTDARRTGCLGFAIRREDHLYEFQWLAVLHALESAHRRGAPMPVAVWTALTNITENGMVRELSTLPDVENVALVPSQRHQRPRQAA
jgi:hypothetical protein